MQIAEYLDRDDRIVLPVGSTEQHGYLSLGTDALLAERVSAEAAEPLGVPVLPVLPFGMAPYFTRYPGTMSLRIGTYIAVLRDLLDCLAGQGFRRIAVINGHGGNAPVAGLIREWISEPRAERVQVLFHSWGGHPGRCRPGAAKGTGEQPDRGRDAADVPRRQPGRRLPALRRGHAGGLGRGRCGSPRTPGERMAGHMSDKVAVVTGAAHGIGTTIADMLEADGIQVHRVDKDTADLTDSAAVSAFFAHVGEVDILVNNAGGVVGQVHHPIEDITDEAWSAVVAANLTSTFLCTKAVAPSMKRRGWGRIVNISSGAGRSVSLTGIQAYASAKAGQIGFTRQMAYELGRYGITVNCIAPGFVLSNPSTIKQWESYGEQGQAALVEGIAVRRLGKSEDIANGVRFFVSEESSWVTGQTISIDGGHALF
jgi:3-oxoacyl-[acyl-carrier protein] reductase